MTSVINNSPNEHGDDDEEEEEVVEHGGGGELEEEGAGKDGGKSEAAAEEETRALGDLHPLLHSNLHLKSSSPSAIATPPIVTVTSNSKALIPFTGSFSGFPFPHHHLLSNKESDNHKRALEISLSDTKLHIKASGHANHQIDDDKEKQESREHKKRSKNWSRSETLILIRLRIELAPRFAKGGRKIDLWDEIAESLQKGPFFRDAQQCRDKWEKLMAGYKEVRDGLKHKDDNPYYDELHPLLSGRILKRERGRGEVTVDHPTGRVESIKTSIAMDTRYYQDHHCYKMLAVEGHLQHPLKNPKLDGHLCHETYQPLAMDGHHHQPPAKGVSKLGLHYQPFGTLAADSLPPSNDEDDTGEDRYHARKQRRASQFLTATDLRPVQTLLESIIARQQRFFQELLDARERKEELREQMRQEREEKWRAEERAQRVFFYESMHILTHKLRTGDVVGPSTMVVAPHLVTSASAPPVLDAQPGLKKRSKNWKRGEVLQLIKLRGEMEDKFAKSNKRAVLWEGLAQMLTLQGMKRDAKQCREKWEKLMSEFKDVVEGKKDRADSPYFPELEMALEGRSERQEDACTSSACPMQDERQAPEFHRVPK